MKVWAITAGIIGALGMIGGPIAAVDYFDSRYASSSLEIIYLEDKVLELEEECEIAEENGDVEGTIRSCDRYLRAKAQLCREHPESWLCEHPS